VVLYTLKGHEGPVNSVSFSPDGTRIVSGSNDATIKLWDAATGEELRTLKVHENSVNSVSFSPDGMRIASGSHDSTIKLWDSIFYVRDEDAFRRRFAAPKPNWHADQAAKFEQANDWFAALFHRAWLLKINPFDAWAYDDLQEASRKHLAANGNQSLLMPVVALEMLKLPRGTDLPQLNEDSADVLYQQIWELVKRPAVEGTSNVSNWHLQRMQDVCSRFTKGEYFNTLGILQYRLGRFEDAIVSLNKSIELSSAETGDPAPLPFDVGMLAMSYFKADDSVKSNEMYEAFRSTVSLAKWNLQPDIQRLIEDVETTLQKSTTGEAAVSIEGFNREATFEGLYRHHWQFWFDDWQFLPVEYFVASLGLGSENAHDGQTCLQASYGPVMAYQAVTVEPSTKYRLTGWIRYELPPTDPASESTPAASNQAEAVQATTTTENDSPSEPSSTPIPGASIGLLNRPETSEVISATTDWKQVTLEFTTTETETTVSPGFRLGLEGQQISGTAWFDDLKLEVIE
jgi:hypothetical protein